jgi:hypothetical protein
MAHAAEMAFACGFMELEPWRSPLKTAATSDLGEPSTLH